MTLDTLQIANVHRAMGRAEEERMKRVVRKMSGREVLPSMIAIRKRKILVFATLPELRQRLPHEYRNTFTYRNPERKGICDLCNRKRKNSRHTF